MEIIQDEVTVYCLPDGACCRADEKKRSPIDLDACPMGYDVCTGDCYYYEEE